MSEPTAQEIELARTIAHLCEDEKSWAAKVVDISKLISSFRSEQRPERLSTRNEQLYHTLKDCRTRLHELQLFLKWDDGSGPILPEWLDMKIAEALGEKK